MKTKVIAFRTNLVLSLCLLIYSCCCIAQEKSAVSASAENKQESIGSIYHPDIVGISKNGIVKGQSAMMKYIGDFKKDHGSIQDFKTHYKRSVVSGLDYEIGSFQTEKEDSFSHVIIWGKENGKEQRLLEVVYEMTSNEEVPVEIGEAREKWVQLCNSHNSNKLVRELYTEDAIYYNRGRLLRGHKALSQEYGYMQQPSYTLELTPEHIEMVSEDMAFEIGKCSGSYHLPYILVWKKQADESWKVFFDSNY